MAACRASSAPRDRAGRPGDADARPQPRSGEREAAERRARQQRRSAARRPSASSPPPNRLGRTGEARARPRGGRGGRAVRHEAELDADHGAGPWTRCWRIISPRWRPSRPRRPRAGRRPRQAPVHGGRLVARTLRRRGVSKLFTLSGGHLFSIYDGCKEEGIEIVDVRHEQSAAFAAEGWAKATRGSGSRR